MGDLEPAAGPDGEGELGPNPYVELDAGKEPQLPAALQPKLDSFSDSLRTATLNSIAEYHRLIGLLNQYVAAGNIDAAVEAESRVNIILKTLRPMGISEADIVGSAD